MQNLRDKSIRFGFLLEDHEACCGHTKQPSAHEVELATHKHRWPEMQKVHKGLFESFMGEVTENEIAILKILDLPDIDTLRKDFIGIPQDDVRGVFTINDSQIRRIKAIFEDWGKDLLSPELWDASKIKKQSFGNDAPYPFYMHNAYSIGAEKTLEDALRALPDWMDEDKLKERFQVATFENRYLRAVLLDGGSRIKTELTKKQRDFLIKELKNMANEGLNPLVVGRRLHKEFEGKSWYWNRLARSESGLAANAAFFANAKEFKVPYQQWDASSTACMICAAFDGRIWKLGSFPQPVVSTHPHCMCTLRVIYQTENVIQRPYNRDPYANPYSREEMELLEGLFR